VRPEGLCQRKIPVTSHGNRNRDLPACSAVPRPTALPRAPDIVQRTSTTLIKIKNQKSYTKQDFLLNVMVVLYTLL